MSSVGNDNYVDLVNEDDPDQLEQQNEEFDEYETEDDEVKDGRLRDVINDDTKRSNLKLEAAVVSIVFKRIVHATYMLLFSSA